MQEKIQIFKKIEPYQTSELFTLQEVKNWIKETTNDNDNIIQFKINSIIEFVESYINCPLLNTNFLLKLDTFSNYQLSQHNYLPIQYDCQIKLYKGLVNTINEIKYYDINNILQIFNVDSYDLIESYPFNYIKHKLNQAFPITYYKENAIEIKLTAGFGDIVIENEGEVNEKRILPIPFDLQEAILNHIQYSFEECNNIETNNTIPLECDIVYKKYRKMNLFNRV